MSTALVGFSNSTRIPANTLFRLTLAEDTTLGYARAFPDQAAAVYGTLYTIARAIPTTKLDVTDGDRATVIDAMLKDEMSGADFVNKLHAAETSWTEFTRVELLTGSARAEATSQAGAATRDEQAQTLTERLGATTLAKKIAEVLGVTAKVAIAIVLVLLLALLWYFLPHRG